MDPLLLNECLAPVEPNGCGKPSYRNGLCVGHRQRRLRRQRIDTPINLSQNKTKHAAYGSWRSMRERCQNPNNRAYKYYGGKGIAVFQEWNDFLAFRDWAEKNGYEKGLTIERLDVDKDYCPDNCTWIPLTQQARNRSNSKLLNFQGETKTEVEWSEDYRCKVSYSRFRDRIRLGFTVEEALGELTKDCDWDGQLFHPITRNARFCSSSCRTAYWNSKQKKEKE